MIQNFGYKNLCRDSSAFVSSDTQFKGLAHFAEYLTGCCRVKITSHFQGAKMLRNLFKLACSEVGSPELISSTVLTPGITEV